jgi:hypothetical protein
MKYKGMKNKNKLPEHLKETDFVSSWFDKLAGSDSRAGDKKYYRGNPVHFNCIYIPTPPHDKDLKDYPHFDYRVRTTEENNHICNRSSSDWSLGEHKHDVVYGHQMSDSKIVPIISRTEEFYTGVLIKEKPMKQKKFYHTFEINSGEGDLEREVTLCILTKELDPHFTNYYLGISNISVGYSIRVYFDKDIPGLSKKIALGRAEKNAINGGRLDSKYLFDNGVLKGIAYYWENEFRRDLGKYVKGAK